MLESYWLQICPYYDSRVVNYERKMFTRLATGVYWTFLFAINIRKWTTGLHFNATYSSNPVIDNFIEHLFPMNFDEKTKI